MIAPIALTCGEPAGVGPEIAAKAWQRLQGDVSFFWIGDPAHLPEGTPLAKIDDPSEVDHAMAFGVPVLMHPFPAPAFPGRPNPENAAGVIDVIARAVKLVTTRAASAVCTAPINKKALKDGANFAYPGHTEYLAALAGGADVVMMLACEKLRVIPATIHIPLSKVATSLTPAGLEQVLHITRAAMVNDFGLSSPRIAVAGLNPHAGEGGAMGQEELDWINPLLDRLRDQGMNLIGPLPADTMFHDRARKAYDVAVAMYHDQALIPIKTLDFAGGVNVTLGLPFVRTSPDHGTAFDIAGQGVADPSSLIAALRMAKEMAAKRTG